VLVFLLPPSAEALEMRLRTRGEDSEEQIQRRLQVAREELRAVPEYDYVVVNDDLDACVDRLRGIVLAERARPDAMQGEVAGILASFGLAAGGR
jgi:guanylate kinase